METLALMLSGGAGLAAAQAPINMSKATKEKDHA